MHKYTFVQECMVVLYSNTKSIYIQVHIQCKDAYLHLSVNAKQDEPCSVQIQDTRWAMPITGTAHNKEFVCAQIHICSGMHILCKDAQLYLSAEYETR